MTRILGIETSCDETAAAVVEDGARVLSNVVASQFDLHAKYGGVVPEIASRAHIERLDAVVEEALCAADTQREGLDAIAVTYAPGLVGALLIGVAGAKALAWAWKKPLIGVHHIEAHAISPAIGADRSVWPAVALVVSGGHTSLFHVHDPDHIDLLGATTDDAAGEAFDKVATILGLPYPGGPQIDCAARQGNPRRFDFPRTTLSPDSLDFSFSGVKTAVLYQVHGKGRISGGLERLSPQDVADIAASFQQAVVDVLVAKTLLAAERVDVQNVVIGGGVAANSSLRTALGGACERRGLRFKAANLAYCMDNAAMIAAAGFYKLRRGEVARLDLDAKPS